MGCCRLGPDPEICKDKVIVISTILFLLLSALLIYMMCGDQIYNLIVTY